MDDRELLEKILEKTEENNKMLHKMRSIMRWARFARIIYWLILIGGAVGAYYYIQPYVDQLLKIYGDFKGVGSFLR